ncbi:MAG: NADH-quinone oxidoreductase subunit L [Verrucomicrobia bacterium Tous-C9LFEB]|nr:MAG: NADH-quinone oxidoreductase subunit L [Verrucomicrobia bacterium Tous-C9LFEB]
MSCKNPFNHDITPADAPLLNVQVDGQWVQLPRGLNVVEAAKRVGKFIPHYCYHPKLSISGNCRMCLIEMGTPKMGPDRKPIIGADGKPEIGWIPRPQIGCATMISEGMGIRTDSPMVQDCRKGVMEFLLINHPLDCPICDQAGECKLQEFSVEYGNEDSRFVEQKVHKPKQVDIGERIVLDDERCIMCSRCIRFSREMVNDDVLGFTQRGSHTTLAVHPGKRLDNNYSLNTVDICPVGALTSKDFRFKMRVWFLKETKSICTGCATGCNILVGSRENVVHRLTPRENELVNSEWMCDQGRLGFHYIHAEERLLQPTARVNSTTLPVAWDDAFAQIRDRIKSYKPEQIAIIGSARMTNEELFLLAELRAGLGGNAVLTDVVPRTGEADGILRSADLNPNTAGAKLFQISNDGKNLAAIKDGIESGRIKVLYALHEDPVGDAGLSESALAKLDLLITQKLLKSHSTDIAHFSLPGASFAEKRGSMINGAGRLQRLNKAIATPGQTMDDFEILLKLRATITGGNSLHTIEEVFKAVAASIPALSGLSLSKVGDLGVEVAPAAATVTT